MNPIKKVRLSNSVIDAVKEMITVESFNPGDTFYSENGLTQKREVSRSPIPEPIRTLEVTNHVSVRREKGICIADSQQQRFKTFSDWLKNKEQEIKDNFAVRLIHDKARAENAMARHLATALNDITKHLNYESNSKKRARVSVKMTTHLDNRPEDYQTKT